MSLTVEIPVLESVALSAGSVGYIEHTGGELKLDVSGGAEVTSIGTTPDLRLTATTGRTQSWASSSRRWRRSRSRTGRRRSSTL